jgi:hypothetical protein
VQDHSHNLARISFHERALAIAHLAAFVGTGLAWLAFDPHPYIAINRITGHIISGAYVWTLISVLWVSWPYLVSFLVSRVRLPGKTSATWLFVGILTVVAVCGGVTLRFASDSDAPKLSALALAVIEAALLTSVAKGLRL